MRVVQRGDDLRFAPETLAAFRIRSEMLGKDFDRDRTIEPCVNGPIDFAHAARRNERCDVVRPETTADEAAGHGRLVKPANHIRDGRELRMQPGLGSSQEVVRLAAVVQQRFDFFAQTLISSARIAKKPVAPIGVLLECGVIQPFDLCPAFRTHAVCPARGATMLWPVPIRASP